MKNISEKNKIFLKNGDPYITSKLYNYKPSITKKYINFKIPYITSKFYKSKL